MAIVTTTLIPELTFVPWTEVGHEHVGIESNPKPFGELIANTRDGVITLSGVGDTQEVRWSITLPPNFSYVLKDLAVSVAVDGTNTWPAQANLVFFNTSAEAPQTFEYGLGMTSEGLSLGTTVTEARHYRPAGPLPSFMQLADNVWQIVVVNATLQEPVANFNGVGRFLMYSIAQQFDTSINTPLLTR